MGTAVDAILVAVKRVALVALGVLGIALSMPAPVRAQEAPEPPREYWSFAGMFGSYDPAQLQRGYRIYKDVCSSCHSMKDVAFRNLADRGGPDFTEGQVKALAATFKVKEKDSIGKEVERPGRPADYFPSPDENAMKATFGVEPPDMSVLALARTYERGFPTFIFDAITQYQEQGVDYIAALLNGYGPPPKDVKLSGSQQWNKYFPGHKIAMPPPLADGAVDYTDGTPKTLRQYSLDVAAFLHWAADPKLDQRKAMGLRVLIFLIVFASLLYFVKKRIWHDVHAPPVNA